MEKLTKAEEEIMRIIWELEPCTVGDIRKYLADQPGAEKPPHSTISTLVANINKKGFLDFQAYGRTYVYSAKVTQEDYSRKSVKKLVRNFFGGSMNALVSFLVKQEELSKEELSALLEKLEDVEKRQNDD